MKQQKFMKEKTNQWGMTQSSSRSVFAVRNIFFSALVAVGLSACGGGNPADGLGLGLGQDIDTVDNGTTPPDQVVAVHEPADNDVQYFVDTLYGILVTNCSNCHNTSVRPDAPFADDADPNAAYYSALELLGESDFENLPVLKAITTSPFSGSRFQTKMIGGGNGDSGGHNCGSSCAEWATEMGTQIAAWATLARGGLIADENFNPPTNESVLSAPPDGQPRATIVVDLSDSMAADYQTHLGLFTTNLYTPYLSQYCSTCHSRAGDTPPHFADSDPDYAFRQIMETRKVDLNTPLNSRIFLRLAQDQHNCWSTCGNASSGNAGALLSGINAWSGSNLIGSQDFNEADFVNSRALFLNDGQVASGGVRYDRFVIAKYVFDEGTGSTVHDQSGVFPATDLTLTGDYEWLSSYGVIFRNGSNARSRSITASQKLYDQIIPRGEFSIEAWVVPANVAQDGPAALVSYSASPTSRNFTAGQSTTYYDFALRKDSTAAGDNLSTDPDPGDVVLTSQQHVVMTYSTTEGRRIYVDGVPKLCETDVSTIPACESVAAPMNGDMGDLLNWSAGQVLTLASEPNGQRQWQGMIRMVAIHNRSLAQEQISQNFEAGVGQKFNLLFAIGNRDVNGTTIPGVAGVPDNSYIWFEVSQFDNFSYSFSTPYFIILDNTLTVATLPAGLSVQIKNMRIGLNGKEPEVGQGYTKLDYTVTTANFEPDPSNPAEFSSVPPKWLMSRIGTIIAKENGVSDDQFFLTFEILGDANMVRVPGTASALPFQYVAPSAQFTSLNTVVGLRTFNEISATMAALTKTNPTGADRDTINDLLTQLPAKTIMEGFVASQQMAIANLAGVYCNNLVENRGLETRASYFNVPESMFNNNDVNAAFSPANQNAIIAALAKNIVGQESAGNDIANQPSLATITTELNNLLNGYTDDDGSPVVGLKASCVNGLGGQNCNDASRTRAIVKAMCMATLGSAAVSHQ